MTTKISSLETNFTKCLELIVKQCKVSNKASQQCLEAAETLWVSKQILEAFEAAQARADQAVHDVNELCIKLKECEVCDNALR
jgi:hypothetical protein